MTNHRLQAALEKAIDEIRACPPPDGARIDDDVALLVTIRECRQTLACLYEEIEQACIQAARGCRTLHVSGVGEIQIVRTTQRRNWRHDDLWTVATNRAATERRLDRTTGEIEPATQALSRVLRACIYPSWRLGALRSHGIDPDEYCEVADTQLKLRLGTR